jgi:hypothetical protein
VIASINTLLKKIDDLRAAALEARTFARRLDTLETRESILQLAAELEAQATREEERIRRFALEAECT